MHEQTGDIRPPCSTPWFQKMYASTEENSATANSARRLSHENVIAPPSAISLR
jgi:hypothetical protein